MIRPWKQSIYYLISIVNSTAGSSRTAHVDSAALATEAIKRASWAAVGFLIVVVDIFALAVLLEDGG